MGLGEGIVLFFFDGNFVMGFVKGFGGVGIRFPLLDRRGGRGIECRDGVFLDTCDTCRHIGDIRCRGGPCIF